MQNPGTKFPENNFNFSDHKRKINGSYNSYGGMTNHGVHPRKAEDYGRYRNWTTIGVFGAETKVAGDEDSGVCSPPLWKSSPQHRGSYYRSLSPSSRAHAIARGQKELMDMVSRMPEGCFELSLKDLVEQPVVVEEAKQKQENFCKERGLISNEEEMQKGKKRNKKKMDRKVKMNGGGSINNGGFLLKMVFPISWGSRRKEKNNSSAMNNSLKDGRASPKPLLRNGSANGAENEWWKKRIAEEGETESGGMSSNSGSLKSSGSSSGSSSRNSSRHKSGGCWPLILTKMSKKAE